MSKEAKIVYDLMLEQFEQTRNRKIQVQVPIALSNKRTEIAAELEFEGLISDPNIYGQRYISCTLSDDNLCIIDIEY